MTSTLPLGGLAPVPNAPEYKIRGNINRWQQLMRITDVQLNF